MRLVVIILIISFLVWLLFLGLAEKIGNAFLKFIVNPIKDLFK